MVTLFDKNQRMEQLHDSSPSQPKAPFVRRALANWLLRHQHPFSFWIHMIGIPMTVVGVALVILYPMDWHWGVGAFVFGYALQYVGHRVEGNDMGEWAGIKRLLGLPYVAISPRWQKKEDGT